MSLLSENQVEEILREISIGQLEPVESSGIERNTQYRIYQIGGQFYAVEVAVPSGWFVSVERISENDVLNFTN